MVCLRMGEGCHFLPGEVSAEAAAAAIHMDLETAGSKGVWVMGPGGGV